MDLDHFMARPGKFNSLKKFSTSELFDVKQKKEAAAYMEKYIRQMQGYQDKLYAHNRYSLLLIFQAMDAAGKDSTISHVMSGLNPQGCEVFSFKQPSSAELDHDFLWRTTKCMPERGRIGIFNRSYYEEVLVVKVHPEWLLKQNLPTVHKISQVDAEFWKDRYKSINDLEKHMVKNGTQILKFFLHVSKEEQANRFLKRINDTEKNWKFSLADLEERKFWDQYQQAYEDMIRETSTDFAPWYIIPADRKWYMQLVVAEIMLDRVSRLDIQYPVLDEKQLAEIKQGKEHLEQELNQGS